MAQQRSPLERKLIRIAYHTRDKELRRGILDSLRLAGYNKEFLKAVEGQLFSNPASGKKVKFTSLPSAEQSKLYQQWKSQQTSESGGKKPAPKQQQTPAPAPAPEPPKSAEPPAKAPEPKAPEPKEPEAPASDSTFKPTGKHKDRKELRGVGKKRLTDTATVDEKLRSLMIPHGLDETQRAKASKNLEGATYELLQRLKDKADKSLSKPKLPKSLLEAGYTPESFKEMRDLLAKKLEDTKGYKYTKPVLEIANKYDLEGEDADELRHFRGDKPHRGRQLSPQEIMQKFLAKAKPETRERMQGMPIGDFMAMYKAILAESAEEDTLEGKMAGRQPSQAHDSVSRAFRASPLTEEDRQLVRLAWEATSPALRRQLLRLVLQTE